MSSDGPSDPSARPRAVGLDWGGVFTVGTFDSSAVVALARLVGADPRRLEPTYLALMAEFEAGAFDLPGFHRRFCDATGSRPDLAAFRSAFLGAVRERPEAYELVAALPPDVKVGMLSNNVAELCDLVRGDPRLGRVGAFVFSNEIGVRKPDPAAYRALLAALGEEARDVVFVDDNPANVAAARDLGIVGVLLDVEFPRRWREAVPSIPLPPALAAARWG